MAKPQLVKPDEERRMTVIEHLEELRRVLIISLIAWGIATVLAFVVSGWILQVLLVPIKQVIGNQPLYFTRPVDKFLLYFKIGLFGGLILAAPIIFWQVWGFVAPGLRRAERRFAIGFVASASLLFVLGIFFAFFALPIALRFLIGFGTSDIKYFPLAVSYINFALLLIAIFGITFELPLALTMLGLVGIVTPAFLNHNRFKFWIGIFIGANFVTPGADPFTPLLLTVPLILLFEVSIQVIRALRR
jgi:sec-independent protein translocase protein TatC